MEHSNWNDVDWNNITDEKLEKIILRLFQNKDEKLAENAEVVYLRRTKKYSWGIPVVVTIISISGARRYPSEIAEKDRLFLLGIAEAHRNKDGEIEYRLNEYAYSIRDQLELWKPVLDVIVLPSEKKKRLNQLQELLNGHKGEEIKLGDLY